MIFLPAAGVSVKIMEVLLSLTNKPECRERRPLVLLWDLLGKKKIMIPNRKMAAYAKYRCVKMRDFLEGVGDRRQQGAEKVK